MVLHFKTTSGKVSMLVVSHCTVFTIKTSSHVMRMGNRRNLRYCDEPTVIAAHFKTLLIRTSNFSSYFGRNISLRRGS